MNKLTMIVRHEINEQEMIGIFDQFAGSIIDGYPCEELTEYLHESVRKLAANHYEYIPENDFKCLLEDFVSCFGFDGKNSRYLFKFEDMEFYGDTKAIRAEPEVKAIYAAHMDCMYRSKYAISPRESWAFFYRSLRLARLLENIHLSGWLSHFDNPRDNLRHMHTPKMKACVYYIFYSRRITRPSQFRRYELARRATDSYKDMLAAKALLPFDPDIPF